MAESLVISIDIGQAKEDLAAITAEFEKFAGATDNVNGRAGGAISRLADAMSKLKPLDGSITTSVQDLGAAMELIKGGNIAALVTELNKLSKIDASAVAKNIQALSAELANLKIPPGLDAMAATLGNLASAAGNAKTAIGAVAPTLNTVQAAAKTVGVELVNVVGYASNLGVSFGQLIPAMSNLVSGASGVGGAFTAMVAAIGPLGAALAVVGGAVIVFKALAGAAEAIVGPVLKATQEYQSFVNVIDVLRGKGAGAKEFAELQKIANSTGQSMESMTKNFKNFEAAASASNISAAKSQEIFKGVSTGLGVMGVSTQQGEKAWLALTQMMSKGTVQAEELRGQFGDAVPGAVKIFADALGVSTKQLEQMMKAGQLVTADVLPKVAEFMGKKFEGGLAASLETSTAAINRFGNAMQQLLITMGQGNIGGIAQGFASGLNAISAALESPALKQFAALLGDLIGLLVGGVMAALGGFLKGILDVFSALGQLASLLGQGIKAFTDWLGITDQAGKSLGIVMTVIKYTAEAVGLLAGAFLVLNAVSIVTTVGAWIAGFTGLATLLGGVATAAVAGFGAVVAALGAPMVIAIAALAAIVTAITYFTSSANSAGVAAEGYGGKLSGLNTGADFAAKGLSAVNKELKDAPGSAMAAAAAMTSVDQAQKQAAQSSADLKDKIRDNNNALKENSLSERAMERDTKSYIASLQSQKQSLQEASQHVKNHSKDMKLNAQASKEAGQAASGMGESSVGVTRKTEGLKRAMQDLDNEIKSVQASEEDRKRRNADFADSLREQSQRYQEMQQRIQEYKVSLSDAQVAEVKQLESWGLAKTEAANLVKQYELLTQSIGDQAKALDAKAAQDEKAAQYFKDQVDKINAIIAARRQEMEAAKQSEDVIKAALAPLEAYRTKLGGLEEGFVKSAAQNRIAAEVLKGSTNIMETAKTILDDLATKFGVKLPDAATAASTALDTLKTKLGGVNDEMKKGDSDGWFNKFMKAIGLMNEVPPSADRATTGFKKTADATTELGTKSEQAGQKMAALVDGSERAAMGVQVLGNNVPKTTASLQEMGTVLQQVDGTAVASWNSMDMLAGQTKTLSDTVLASESAWKQQIQTMKEGQATEWANVEGNRAMNEELRTQLGIVESAPAKYDTWSQAIERIKTPLGEVIIQSDKLIKTTHDNTAARQADIDSLKQWIASNEASAQGSIQRIAEYEKEQAILDRVTASRKENTDGMLKSKSAGDEVAQAQRERVIGYEQEAAALGRSRQPLIERIKGLQDEKNAIGDVDGSRKEEVAVVDAVIKKYQEQVDASFWIQDAYKAMAASGKDWIDTAEDSNNATQRIAETSKQAAAGVEQVGTSMDKASEKTAAAKNNIYGFTQSFAQEVDGLAKGVGIFDVLGEKGQKLGEVAIDTGGKIRGFSQSLKDSAPDAEALSSGLGPVADAAKKAADGMGTFGGATTILKAAGSGIADIWTNIGTSLLGFNVAQVQTLATAKEWVSSGISEGLARIGDEVKILTGNMEPGSTAAQLYGQMLDQAAAKEQAAGDAAAAAALKTQQATAARDAMRVSTEQMKGILEQSIPAVDALAASTTNAGIAERQMAEQLDQMLTSLPAVTEASTQLAAAEKGVVDGLAGMDSAGASFDNFAGSVLKAADATTSFVERVGESDGKLDGMREAISSANSIANDFISNLQREAAAVDALGDQAQDTANQLKEMNDQENAGGGSNSGGGGGGGLTEYMREGGIVGQATQKVRVDDMSIFKGAPKFSEGGTTGAATTNRSRGGYWGSYGGDGGIPTILHPNEAVVPLSRGRSIPVQISGATQRQQTTQVNLSPVTNAIRSLTALSLESWGQLNLGVRMQTRATRDQTAIITANGGGGGGGLSGGLNPPPKLIDGTKQRALHGSDPRRAHPLRTNRDMTGELIPNADVRGGSMAGEDNPRSDTYVPPIVKKTTINVTMHSGRFDNFKMTQDQLARAAQTALDRVQRQNS